ncbi:hypothetical protein EDB83DRAFT_2371828 [Lactarius deliciosus]|nr:hypothetical protein EDB83DRAFT_2371828 [Lactarius deliciosus]
MGDGIISQYYARRPSRARCPPDVRPCARRLQNALRPKTLLTQTPDLPTAQRLAPPSHVAPGLFTTEDASSADVDMLLGLADESDAFLPPDRTRSTTSARNTGGDAAHGADGRPAAAERGALLRRAGGGPGGSSHLRGEVGPPRESTQDEVSGSIERRRRRDCVFGHDFCHSAHMRGDWRRSLASQWTSYVVRLCRGN